MAVLTAKERRAMRVAFANKFKADAVADKVDASVTIEEGEIADLAVATAKLNDLAVTSGKLGGDAVSGADKIANDAVDTEHLVADLVTGDEIEDNAVSLEHLDSGIAPGFITILAVANATSTRENNVQGLATALALGESLRTVMNAHAADAVEHTAGADGTNFPLTSPTADDIASLIVLVTEQLDEYEDHNDDAVQVGGWSFHEAQQAGNTLASTAPPINLQECITRLNDIKAKYNTHESSAVSHDAGSAHTEATADGTYGAANLVTAANVASGDIIKWAILDDGSGSVTGVTAVAGTGAITFTFSGDPQNDAIFSYLVDRAAA